MRSGGGGKVDVHTEVEGGLHRVACLSSDNGTGIK